MSRQKIRDERPEEPTGGARAEWPRKRGEEPSDGLWIAPEDVSRGETSTERRPLTVAGPEAEPAERPDRPEGRHLEAVLRTPDIPPSPEEEPAPAPAEAAVSERAEAQPAEASVIRGEESRRAAEATARRWFHDGLVTVPQARAISQMIGEGEPGPEELEALAEAGVITRSQAAAIRRRQHPNGLRPVPAARSRAALEVPAAARRGPGVRPPRLSLDARKLGVLLAGIALVGLVWAAASLFMDVFVTPRRPVGVGLLDSLRVLAGVLALFGGRRMYRGVPNGKPLALIGLVLYGLASVLLAVRRLGDPVAIALMLGWAVLYYLTTVSRFRPVQPVQHAPGPK
jgi:hypothetical protein